MTYERRSSRRRKGNGGSMMQAENPHQDPEKKRGFRRRRNKLEGDNMEKEKIKECPFCGGENLKLVIISQNKTYAVRCMNCLAMGPVGRSDLDAVKFWENGVYSEIGIFRKDRKRR